MTTKSKPTKEAPKSAYRPMDKKAPAPEQKGQKPASPPKKK